MKLYFLGCDLKWLFTGYEDFFFLGFNKNKILQEKITTAIEHLILEYGDQEDDIPEYPDDANLNIPYAKNLIRRWKFSKSLSSSDLVKLAQLTGTDLIWFFTTDEDNKSAFHKYLTKNEMDLIQQLRQIPGSAEMLLHTFKEEKVKDLLLKQILNLDNKNEP